MQVELETLVAHLRAAGVCAVTLKFERGVTAVYAPEPLEQTGLPPVPFRPPAPGVPPDPDAPPPEREIPDDRFAASGVLPVDVERFMREVAQDRRAAELEREQNPTGKDPEP